MAPAEYDCGEAETVATMLARMAGGSQTPSNWSNNPSIAPEK